MKRAALSPLASRNRSRRRPGLKPGVAGAPSCGAGITPAIPRSTTPAPAASARPTAKLRTFTTGRATRYAYFNALYAFITPAR